MDTLHRIALALIEASSEHPQKHLPIHIAELVRSKKLPNARIFVSAFNPKGPPPACTPDLKPDAPAYRFGDFLFITGGFPESQVRDSEKLMLALSCKVNNPLPSRLAAFLDGHVQTIPDAKFAAFMEAQNRFRAECGLSALDLSSIPGFE